MRSFSYYYMSYIVPASTLIPIITGAVFYKRINKPLRTLLIYLVIALVINVIAIILASNHITNLPLLHFYTIFEVVAIMLYYKQAYGPGKTDKWIHAVMMGFPVLCIINFSFFQSLYEFNTYTRPLGSLIIILFSIAYLAIQQSLKNQKLNTASGRLVAAGFLIYFCSTLFQFTFSNVLSHSATKELKTLIWDLHATLVLIMYLFFFAAILNERNKR